MAPNLGLAMWSSCRGQGPMPQSRIASGGRTIEVPVTSTTNCRMISGPASCGSADAWDAGVFAPFFPRRKMHYRNKWYVDLGEAPLLFRLGIHGQYLFVDRRNQL